MKTLYHKDEWAVIECDCGKKFEVDAVTQENLVLMVRKSAVIQTRELLAKCPKCGKIDND